MSGTLITKQGAAQRQIDAAIRMLFLHGEDFTAIHTIAAAARTIIKDLAEAQGVSHLGTRRALEQMHRDALAAVARSSETGEAVGDAYLQTLAQAAAVVSGGVIPKDANFELSDLDPTHPEIAADIDRRARAIESSEQTWNYRNGASNFLKHANPKYRGKDTADGWSLSDLNVFGILVHAIDLWMEMNLSLTDEMEVYGKWFSGVTAETPDQFLVIDEQSLHLLNLDQQIEAGKQMLERALRAAKRSIERFRVDTVYRPGDIKLYCGIN